MGELYKLENPGKYAKLEGFSSDKYENVTITWYDGDKVQGSPKTISFENFIDNPPEFFAWSM